MNTYRGVQSSFQICSQCSRKVFLQLPQASTPELTAERNLEVEDIPTKHRTCAATALVIVARLRQRNVAPDRR